MSNRTYICADCRTAKRAEAGGWMRFTHHPCPMCGKLMCEMSLRYRIPSKRDDKVWRELKEFAEWYFASYEERRREHGRKLLAKIDQKIKLLERQNSEGDRQGWLNELRKEREEVVLRFLGGEAEKTTQGLSAPRRRTQRKKKWNRQDAKRTEDYEV